MYLPQKSCCLFEILPFVNQENRLCKKRLSFFVRDILYLQDSGRLPERNFTYEQKIPHSIHRIVFL